MDAEVSRGKWGSKTEFMLSCLGYAIGTGNVWRFPYLCYRNGGGAFLIPYLIMLFFCGIPLFLLELGVGQFSSLGFIQMFRIAPLFKGAGYAIVIVNIIVITYYAMILAYPLLFLVRSFSATLPWKDCGNPWNTEHCFKLTVDLSEANQLNTTNTTIISNIKTPADEFFHNEILHISSNMNELGSIVWPLFSADIVAWLIIFMCIMNGVKSVGKVVYFTATFPFIVLIILFIRGITLPGAIDGIKFYLIPDWKQLLNLKVWADAAIQIFFSLGPGWGGIINMASYNQFRNNIITDSFVVPIVNCGTSIFAGFVVFSVLGYMSVNTGKSVAEVATGGPGLAFVTYPEAIATLPFPQLWAILFFLMLFFLGIDSVFVQLESVISTVVDEYPQYRKHDRKITFGCCVLMFLISILFTTQAGMFILQLFDWYSASISVILVCLMELISVCWIYGEQNFRNDLEFMLNKKLQSWWLFCLKYITSFILLFIFITTLFFNTDVTYNGIPYPYWGIILGWFSCFISISAIPVYMVYKLCRMKGSMRRRIRLSLTPFNWGPADETNRKQWSDTVRRID